MFYCKNCAEERKWPDADWLPVSYGRCEICSGPSLCYDVPSSHLENYRLTPGQEQQNDELAAIKSIKQTIEKRS